MIIRLDHIAFAVRNIEEARRKLERLGAEFLVEMENKRDGYLMVAMRLGELVISLVTPKREDSFIADFLRKRGEGVHHLGMEVRDLDGLRKTLEERGVRVFPSEPEGKGRREVLIGPRDALGTVLQLIEWEGGWDLNPEERIKRMKEFHSKKA